MRNSTLAIWIQLPKEYFFTFQFLFLELGVGNQWMSRQEALFCFFLYLRVHWLSTFMLKRLFPPNYKILKLTRKLPRHSLMSLSLTNQCSNDHFNKNTFLFHSLSPSSFRERLWSYWASSHKSLERWSYTHYLLKTLRYNYIFIVYILLYCIYFW